MSQLVIKIPLQGEFRLNVTEFRSPMSGEVTSVQTRTMQQHFPIRCGQPEIEFTVQFANDDDRDKFKDAVRRHQVRVQTFPNDWVTLWWPERDILNWTGFLTLYPVAIRRFDYAPKVTFGVILIDSLMSEHTFGSSTAAPFSAIFGPQIPFDPTLLVSVADSILRVPVLPSTPTVPKPTVQTVNAAPQVGALPGVGQ